MAKPAQQGGTNPVMALQRDLLQLRLKEISNRVTFTSHSKFDLAGEIEAQLK